MNDILDIRAAHSQDIHDIMRIYRSAQDYMINSGNPNQWGHAYPTEEIITEDIRQGRCRLICSEGIAHGVFALFEGDDPTYQKIYTLSVETDTRVSANKEIPESSWLNEEPYVTIHRIASDGKVRKVFNCAHQYACEITGNVRIDTHKDNLKMHSLLSKNGYIRCGMIFLANGSPRIAYQWTK